MKVLVVAGTRPNFMKIAPICTELERVGVQRILLHTGQHYDPLMSGAFFEDLGIPAPDFHLDAGSGSQAIQTARIMERFEPVLVEEKPQWVVVVGDVTSTLATALVTAKLRYELGCRLAHVEAGLRSKDWRMPEEVNRVLTDRLADLLLTPSRDARGNLLKEGLEPDSIVFVGNVMIDTLFLHLESAKKLAFHKTFGLTDREYAVATIHRPSNVDDCDSLRAVLSGLARIARRLPVILPIHPRTRSKVDAFGLNHLLGEIKLVEPLGYKDMLSLTCHSAIVLTDSGGIQEETSALGIPCVTLREQTERPITVTHGTNRLVPWPMSEDGVYECFEAALKTRHALSPIEGWDGRASERIVEELVSRG
jgi:UDP-N-acetylglucosamine 2-epimerase (non-hydrolysing)